MSGPPHNYEVWSRKHEDELHHCYITDNSFHTPFEFFPFNKWVDLSTKEAALIASPSLVSLISYSGISLSINIQVIHIPFLVIVIIYVYIFTWCIR